jgi:hypothetical protein
MEIDLYLGNIGKSLCTFCGQPHSNYIFVFLLLVGAHPGGNVCFAVRDLAVFDGSAKRAVNF